MRPPTPYSHARRAPRRRAPGSRGASAGRRAARRGLIHATRSRKRTILGTLSAPNPVLWWITAGTVAALLLAVYVPPVAAIFRFAPPSPLEWAVALLAGVAGVLWYEIYKVLRPRGV